VTHLRTRSRSTIMVAALVLVASAMPGAQQKPAPPIVIETVQVNIVNVEIVVTDREGRSIPGLESRDFEVLEDGKPVPITNFYAAVGGRPAPPPGALSPAGETVREESAPTPEGQALGLVFLIDNANLTISRRTAIFEQVRSLLRQGLQMGGAQVLLATAGGAVRIRQPFTSDEKALLATVDSLEHEVAEARGSSERNPLLTRLMGGAAMPATAAEAGTSGGRGALSQDFDRQNALSLREDVRSAAEEAYQQTRVTLNTLTQFVDSLAGLPGRKALVYVGEGVLMRPGEALLQEWEAAFRSYDPTFSAVAEAGRYAVNREFGEMIRRANSARVTFYCVDGSPESGNQGVSAERASMTADPTSAIMSASSLRQSLESMAGATGGRTLAAGPDLAATLARTVEDFQTYYSLGYAAPHLGDGKYHAIEVRVKRDGVRTRYREGYLDRAPDERTAERNLSALFFGTVSNPLGLAVTVAPAEKQKGDTFMVTLSITVPLGNLVFLPREEIHEGSVSLWMATRDADDRVSAPGKKTFPVRIPNDQLQSALGQLGSFTFQMLVSKGPQRVAVTLRDELGQTDSTAVASFTTDVPSAGSAGPT
jgi:VWFA-related protein